MPDEERRALKARLPERAGKVRGTRRKGRKNRK